MGFYGNITNTSNTTFQFDRIYPNRLAMDANANNDGIFIGRYVLVEYQEDAAYPIALGRKETNTIGKYYLYTSTETEDKTVIKYLGNVNSSIPDESDLDNKDNKDGVYEKEIIQYTDPEDNKVKFYICQNSDEGSVVNGPAIFKETVLSTASQYIQNFNIDETHYGQGSKGFKGYDSTVWTKVSDTLNGQLITKYVNIADLNSVVPTFAITADAPTMKPITPHFDSDSTNVYYELHAQPQWGFRVAQADGTNSKSDTITQWKTAEYDPTTDKKSTKYGSGVNRDGITEWSDTPTDINAAIYYNAAGFKKQLVGTSERQGDIKKHDDVVQDVIKIMPTGKSGATYEAHDGTKNKTPQEDIQELTIQLPSIGNMMSDAWDIIHGKQRNDYRGDGENASLQGRLDSFEGIKENQIPVKRNDGTLIGSKINNGKDYEHIGEILEKPVLDTDILENDDPWIRININTDGLVGGTQIGENPDQSNNNGILIQHTFHPTENSQTSIDKNTGSITQNENYKEDFTKVKNTDTGTNDKLKLYTPYVDQAGHVVGYNEETVILPYGYKHFTTNGLVDETQLDLDNSTGRKTTANNTQDSLAINTKNKWLQIEVTNDKIELAHEIHDTTNSTNTTDWTQTEENTTIPTTTYEFDNAGHYVSHHTENYKLPFGYGKIVGDSGSTEATATFDELTISADDNWIATTVSKDKVNITHTGPVTGTPVTVANVEPEFGETFSIIDWQYDSKGHKYGSTTHTVKMPDGSYTPANAATTHTDIITSLGFTPKTGAITSTKANTDTLTLYNYSANSGNLDIKATDTINDGLKKVQNHINGLDMSSISTTDFITEITQIDGQVAVKRAKAGTLELGTDSTEKTVLGTDSLNQAINKIEARIKAEEENRKNAIDTLYGNNGEKIAETFDTIKEIAEFLEQEDNNKQSGVEKIISDINTNTYNIAQEKLRAESAENALSTNLTNEITRATNAENANTSLINQEVSRAQNKENEIVNNLNNEISRATEEEGKLNTRIDNLVGNTKVSTQIDNKINTFNSTLGSAAYTESDMYALAGSYDNRVLQSVYDTKIAELEATILALTARIEALEPESETPVEGE